VISYADATPQLQNLGGPVAPEGWRGALGFTYHIGPGPATAHFKLAFDMSTRPLRDVIATIPGSTYPDEWVIYGNHHDGWVNGAHDPISGAASLLETARALATLRKQGWQPKRTIILALWDGEEFGLLGSTEWAEKHQEELARKGVVYINSDTNSKGTLDVSGSHTLERFMSEVLRDLKDPESGKTLLEASRLAGDVAALRRKPRRFPVSTSARWAQGRTTWLSSTISESPASISDSAVRTWAASTIPSTTIQPGSKSTLAPGLFMEPRSRK
jgi:N-acetylated-alpha-linked acidic dipeptidase